MKFFLSLFTFLLFLNIAHSQIHFDDAGTWNTPWVGVVVQGNAKYKAYFYHYPLLGSPLGSMFSLVLFNANETLYDRKNRLVEYRCNPSKFSKSKIKADLSIDWGYTFESKTGNKGELVLTIEGNMIKGEWETQGKKIPDATFYLERLDLKKNEEDKIRAEQEKYDNARRKILPSVKEANIRAVYNQVELYCEGCDKYKKREMVRSFYPEFRSLPVTPYIVNRLKGRVFEVSAPFWSGETFDDLLKIRDNLDYQLLQKAKRLIENKDVNGLNTLNSEGFYFTDLSTSQLEEANKICNNCGYITTALEANRKKEKEQQDKANREAAAYERRRARESSSPNSSSSSTSGYTVISGNSYCKVEPDANSVMSIDVSPLTGGFQICEEGYSITYEGATGKTETKTNPFYSHNSKSYEESDLPLIVTIRFDQRASCKGEYRDVIVKINSLGIYKIKLDVNP